MLKRDMSHCNKRLKLKLMPAPVITYNVGATVEAIILALLFMFVEELTDFTVTPSFTFINFKTCKSLASLEAQPIPLIGRAGRDAANDHYKGEQSF